jgi:tartrate dehydrogenase/decarboxylase / D-malate dehydrogenase
MRKKHGIMMPADGADQLRAFDTISFGAVGAPDIPDHITFWGRACACRSASRSTNA